MDPVTSSVIVSRPQEEVFEYLADIANHAEFTDHFLIDWHLTREDSYGVGAGARFKIKMRGNRFPWGDVTIAEAVSPIRIVEVGRGGKFNRIRSVGVYELSAAPGGATRVTYTFESEPKTLSDRFLESLGARRFVRRQNGRAMKRLRSILEEDHDRGTRASISGGARKPASNFRI
ncbi:SRPBCC family protein [Paraconexibacter sp.]|uniref:SRPBCC family protein n=1 Tax=Paraconexibacter sp. TaxID=2949640 RepID=UPI00356A1EF8